nr:MAG TPA: DNA-binding protein [Caudoviricetes sp.]
MLRMGYQTKITDAVRAHIKRSGVSQTTFAVRAGFSPNGIPDQDHRCSPSAYQALRRQSDDVRRARGLLAE